MMNRLGFGRSWELPGAFESFGVISHRQGYAQAIALQRVFLFFFMVLAVAGVPLYTPLDQLQSQAGVSDGISYQPQRN